MLVCTSRHHNRNVQSTLCVAVQDVSHGFGECELRSVLLPIHGKNQDAPLAHEITWSTVRSIVDHNVSLPTEHANGRAIPFDEPPSTWLRCGMAASHGVTMVRTWSTWYVHVPPRVHKTRPRVSRKERVAILVTRIDPIRYRPVPYCRIFFGFKFSHEKEVHGMRRTKEARHVDARSVVGHVDAQLDRLTMHDHKDGQEDARCE